MRVAKILAENSTCCRLKVGALWTNVRGQFKGSGWNGVLSGHEHCEDQVRKYCEEQKLDFDEYVKSDEFKQKHRDISKFENHAEANCLLTMISSGGSVSPGDKMFVTTLCCLDCAKMMIAAGIKHVIFEKLYDRDCQHDSLQLFAKSGVKVERLVLDLDVDIGKSSKGPVRLAPISEDMKKGNDEMLLLDHGKIECAKKSDGSYVMGKPHKWFPDGKSFLLKTVECVHDIQYNPENMRPVNAACASIEEGETVIHIRLK
jgi:dCMP deaminase